MDYWNADTSYKLNPNSQVWPFAFLHFVWIVWIYVIQRSTASQCQTLHIPVKTRKQAPRPLLSAHILYQLPVIVLLQPLPNLKPSLAPDPFPSTWWRASHTHTQHFVARLNTDPSVRGQLNTKQVALDHCSQICWNDPKQMKWIGTALYCTPL